MDRCRNERPRNGERIDHEKENVTARRVEGAARRQQWRHTLQCSINAEAETNRKEDDCRPVQTAGQRKRDERAYDQCMHRNLKISLHITLKKTPPHHRSHTYCRVVAPWLSSSRAPGIEES